MKSTDDHTLSRKTQRTRFALLGAVLFAFASWGWLAWASRGVAERWSTATVLITEASLGKAVNLSLPTRRKPMEQFQFWDSKLDRILAANPDSPELYAAAALIMDQPSIYAMSLAAQEVLSSEAYSLSSGQSIFDLGWSWSAEFDQVATPKALHYIKLASEIAPDDPRWLRIRLALTVPPVLYRDGSVERGAMIDDLVATAERIDGDNGIYELIKAKFLLDGAIVWDEQIDDEVFADQERADAAINLARKAIRKPKILIGEPAAKALRRIHELAGHPPYWTTESMMGHSTSSRLNSKIAVFVRQMLRCGSIYERLGNKARAKECFETGIAITDAILERADLPIRHEEIFHFIRVHGHSQLAGFEKNDASNVTLGSSAADAVIAKHAFSVAAKDNAKKAEPAHWIPLLLAPITESFLLTCCVAFVPFAIVAYVVRRQTPFQIQWTALVAFLLGVVLSLVFWGIGPAGYLSNEAQDWLANIVVLIFVGGLIVTASQRWRKKPLQYGLNGLLLLTAISAIGIQSVMYFQLGIPAAVHAKSSQYLQSVNTANGGNVATWIPGPESVGDSLMQWLVQGGPAIALMITLFMIVLGGLAMARLRQAIMSGFLLVSFTAALCLGTWAWTFPAHWTAIESRNDSVNQFLFEPDVYYASLQQKIDSLLKQPAKQKEYLDAGRSELATYEE